MTPDLAAWQPASPPAGAGSGDDRPWAARKPLRNPAAGDLAQWAGGALPQIALSQLAADNFNRANGAIGGANGWAATSAGTMTISANEAIGAAGAGRGDYRTGEAYNSDQYAQCAVGSVALVAGGYIGVSVRNQDNANNYTAIYFNNAGTYEIHLYKKVAGAFTQLAFTTLAGAQPAGTVISLVAEGNMISATIGNAGAAALDSTYTGGVPGIESFGANSLANWLAGNAATPALPAAAASDNFNTGAAVSTDGQPWAAQVYTDAGAIATVDIPIVGAQLSAQNPPITAHAGDVRTDSWNPDHFSSIQMGSAAMSASGFVGATTRLQNAGRAGYLGCLFHNGFYEIYRLDYNAGLGQSSSTLLAAAGCPGNDPAGTSYALVSKGNRHSLRVNGKEILAVTDATYPTGVPGIMLFPNATADNWSGGNI